MGLGSKDESIRSSPSLQQHQKVTQVTAKIAMSKCVGVVEVVVKDSDMLNGDGALLDRQADRGAIFATPLRVCSRLSCCAMWIIDDVPKAEAFNPSLHGAFANRASCMGGYEHG